MVFWNEMKDHALTDIASLKSPQMGERVQTTPKNDPVGNLIIEYERDLAQYSIRILSCKAKMMAIDNQIFKMQEIDENYFRILCYRYRLGLDWQEIADKMFMGLSTVTHLHSPALRKFEELFGENYIDL